MASELTKPFEEKKYKKTLTALDRRLHHPCS